MRDIGASNGNRTVGVGDRFVRDITDARGQRRIEPRAVTAELRESTQRGAGDQQRPLEALRLLDLDDQFALENRGGIARDLRARRGVHRIAKSGTLAGALLDPDLVAGLRQLPHAIGYESDASLAILALARDADAHRTGP